MKIIFALIIVFVLIVGIILIKSKTQSNSVSNSSAISSMTLEQKLELLASCGLKLADPFSSEDLIKSWDRVEYEKPGFDLTLVGLGMTEEQEPWRHHSVNLWHFDTECIEDHGDYKRIALKMAEMTQGSFVLEQIEDYVDIENKSAWLSFNFQGQQIKFDCKVEDDWVDTEIFSKFVELLAKADPSKIYVYYDLGGQDCIIGCVTKSELEELNNNGIKFVPLT